MPPTAPAAAAALLRSCAAAAVGLAPSWGVQGPVRGLAVRSFDHLGKTVGQPISPAQARTSEPLGNWGGAKDDYDEKYPQGPGQPAPSKVGPFGPEDPDAEKRASPDLLLTPHGYIPLRGPEQWEGSPPEGEGKSGA